MSELRVRHTPSTSARRLLANAGFASWSQLARASGVGRATLTRAVLGERAPKPVTIERLATCLGVLPEIVAHVFEEARVERAATRRGDAA